MGDRLVAVNSTPLTSISHAGAIASLKSQGKLEVKFQRTGTVPAKRVTDAKTGWVDVDGDGGADGGGNSGNERLIHESLGTEKKVILAPEDGSLGISIRGGSEMGLGIYISACDPHGPAFNSGLKVHVCITIFYIYRIYLRVCFVCVSLSLALSVSLSLSVWWWWRGGVDDTGGLRARDTLD